MELKIKSEVVPDNSVFLTPPLSNEGSAPLKAVSRIDNLFGFKPLFILEDENDKCKPDVLDILEELYAKSLVPTVCSKIFDQLSDRDLVRISHVSRTWYKIVRYVHIKSGRRISRFLRKRKRSFELNKENWKVPHVFISSEIPRTPLSTDISNIPRLEASSKDNDEPDEVFKTPVASSSKELYKHCPTCQSPARTAFRQTGHCTKCNQDFCIHCFYTKEKHSPTCQIVGGSGVTGSPRKLTSNNRRYSLGSKENRTRLKRL